MNFSAGSQSAIASARQVLANAPVYLDTETTGVSTQDEIIEISILDSDGALLLDQLIRPTKKIPPEAIAIHNITNDQVAVAPFLPYVWQSIKSILNNRIIAAYNADFDIRLLKQSLALYNIQWQAPINQFCIMKCYAQFRGDWDPRRRSYRYVSLDVAGKQCGITLPNSHRAQADALLAREILLYIAHQN
ncbi:MAG: 3'-5' exonuclease [Anaerolineae bacterium]|nr:3'-5' exonuclease [Anaerolineae bacterium]